MLWRRPLSRPSVKTLSETETGAFSFILSASFSFLFLLNRPRKSKPRSMVMTMSQVCHQPVTESSNSNIQPQLWRRKKQKLHFPLKTSSVDTQTTLLTIWYLPAPVYTSIGELLTKLSQFFFYLFFVDNENFLSYFSLRQKLLNAKFTFMIITTFIVILKVSFFLSMTVWNIHKQTHCEESTN